MDVPDPDPSGWCDSVAEQYHGGRPLALPFDYDGTLTPIVHHPSLARLCEQTRQRLAALRDLDRVAVGVVSSRSLRELRELVGLPGLFYAGSGGLELDVYGERINYPEVQAFRAALSGLLSSLIRIVSAYSGAWIERKSVTCSLHFRGVAPLRALAFQREVSSLLSTWPAIRYRVVSQAIEVIPAAGWDRGTAMAALLAWLGEGALPVYAGDDASDAEAMAVTTCLDGVAVGVGREAPSLATHRLGSPDELADSMDRLLSTLTRVRVLPESARRADPAEPLREVSTETTPVGPGILVVDADPLIRAQTAEGLRAEGWSVWEAGAVEEAVGTLRRLNGQIKAAIVDLQMPGIQGWRALSELGATNPALVRCATTAGVAAQAADAFRRTSDTPLFVRPFRVEMVSSELLRLLEAGPG
jgi:trehalose-phosphatase